MLSRLFTRLPGAMGRRLGSTASTLAKSLELVNGIPNETALPLAYWRNPKQPLNNFRDPARDGCGLIWYAPLVPMRPVSVRSYANMVTRVTAAHGMEPLITFTSINDKLFDSTVPLLFDRSNQTQLAAAQFCYRELLGAGQASGFFPYRVGIDAMPALSDLQQDSRTFHLRLKSALDPTGLSAPGRYE